MADETEQLGEGERVGDGPPGRVAPGPDAERPRGRPELADAAGTSDQLRRIVEILPVGAALAEGEWLVINPAVEALTGYSARELETLDDWFRLLYGDEADAVRALYEADRVRGFPEPRVVELRRRNGERRRIEFAAREAGGAVVWSMHDVTGRDATAAALEESQRSLATLLGNLPGMAYRSRNDDAWTMEFVSEGCRALTGYEPADLVASRRVSYASLIHPDDRERVRAEVDAAVAEGRPFHLTYRIVTADGEVRWAWEKGRDVRGPGGEVVALEGFIQDVTARVRADESLQASEARLRAFFDAPNVLFCVVDVDDAADDFVYVMPNRALAAAYGLSPEALAGRRGRDVGIPDEQIATWVAMLRRCRETGEPVTVELNPSRATRPAWLLASINRIGDNAGGHALLAYVATDITERKLLEEQFRQAQKMEAVGRLAGGVAHDFNNLLTVIGGNAEFLLADTPPGDPRRSDVLEIRRAAERARDLTRQLLTFSRRQVVEPRRVDLNALVADAERMLRRVIGEDVRLTTATDPATPAVHADPGQLEQALVNLVVNARDAMPHGGELTIATARAVVDAEDAAAHPGLAAGEYALLSVHDTGVGMDPATRARIFEPFFTTKEPGRGTGLGLSTVFGIVTQAGGYVAVESEPGAGSTFRVYLPPAPAASARAGAAASPAGSPGGSETILVVEDEPHVRRLARRALEQRGYTVLEAADGAEALAVSDAREGPIDLVLTDAVLPGRRGRRIVDALAARRPGIAAVFMSGYAADLPADEDEPPDAPLLEKPFTAEQLAAAVRAALDAPRDG